MELARRQRELPLDNENTFILCVDDEELPLTLRKLVLELQGYQVLSARSAQDAMRALSEHPVDLVLTDQVMPGGTGTELAQSIKKRWPDLPIILISGINEVPPDVMYADLFMSKVEGPAALCAKIAAILAARRCSLDKA
jgi:DNA-binding NtrC family response regulator